MREVTLTEYLADGGKGVDVARVLNVTKGAITQMVTAQRDIRLRLNDKGELLSGYEIKRFSEAKSA